eukprot:9466511-Pyramimonas_sp.AAC.2
MYPFEALWASPLDQTTLLSLESTPPSRESTPLSLESAPLLAVRGARGEVCGERGGWGRAEVQR